MSLLAPPVPRPCYWTSYKGWKPEATLNAAYRAGIVIELPIRDGNEQHCQLLILIFSVIELPIRDGNEYAVKKYYPIFLVIELPIRDGNKAAISEEIARRQRYWTSYKGWKPEGTLNGAYRAGSYWTSYKGWKREASWRVKWKDEGYWTSYKGWKQAFIKPAQDLR